MRSNRDSLTFSSPFWHPLNLSSEERILIGSLSENLHKSISPFLQSFFRATNIQLVNGRNSTETMLIQISYGLRLEDVFVLDSQV